MLRLDVVAEGTIRRSGERKKGREGGKEGVTGEGTAPGRVSRCFRSSTAQSIFLLIA